MKEIEDADIAESDQAKHDTINHLKPNNLQNY